METSHNICFGTLYPLYWIHYNRRLHHIHYLLYDMGRCDLWCFRLKCLHLGHWVLPDLKPSRSINVISCQLFTCKQIIPLLLLLFENNPIKLFMHAVKKESPTCRLHWQPSSIDYIIWLINAIFCDISTQAFPSSHSICTHAGKGCASPKMSPCMSLCDDELWSFYALMPN